MKAGELNRRIQVFTRNQDRAASGSGSLEESLTPTTLGAGDGKVWANVKPLYGNKLFAAQQVNASTTHDIRVRRQEGYRTNMVVKHEVEKGKFQYLTIDAVLPIEDDHTRISLLCTLRESEGWR